MDLADSEPGHSVDQSNMEQPSKQVKVDPEIVKQRTKAKVAQAQVIKKKRKEGKFDSDEIKFRNLKCGV